MDGDPLPQSEIILYQMEDGWTRVQCRLENETLWLTQAQIAELSEEATCKDYLQAWREGTREPQGVDVEFENAAKELKKLPQRQPKKRNK